MNALEEYYEHIIVGGGPAGIQLAYFFEKAHMNYILLEKTETPGAFFATYPRHRTLISVNKVYCGGMDGNKNIENILRYDWNSLLTIPEDNGKVLFRDFSKEYSPPADKLVEYLQTFVKTFSLNIKYKQDIINIVKDRLTQGFAITTATSTYKCQKLYIATGLCPSRLPFTVSPNKQFYYYDNLPTQPEHFMNKTILILGGGNAAFETANFLNNYANSITLCGAERFAWKTHYPGAIRSINMKILDSYYLKLKVNLDWAQADYLRDDSKYHTYMKNLKEETIFAGYDIVIYCGGFKPNTTFLDASSIKLEKGQNDFPVLTPYFESVSCNNLYFIGAQSQQHDYKHGTSAFIHGFRYNCRLLYQHISSTFEQRSSENLDHMINNAMRQMNISSALLHRFDTFSDYILFYKPAAAAATATTASATTASANAPPTYTYIKHLPISLIHNSKLTEFYANNTQPKFIVQMYLGYDENNGLNQTLKQPQTGSDITKINDSVFIHPIFKVFHTRKGVNDAPAAPEFLHALHLPENAFNMFNSYELHYQLVYKLFNFIDSLMDQIPSTDDFKSFELTLMQFYHTPINNTTSIKEFIDK